MENTWEDEEWEEESEEEEDQEQAREGDVDAQDRRLTAGPTSQVGSSFTQKTRPA